MSYRMMILQERGPYLPRGRFEPCVWHHAEALQHSLERQRTRACQHPPQVRQVHLRVMARQGAHLAAPWMKRCGCGVQVAGQARMAGLLVGLAGPQAHQDAPRRQEVPLQVLELLQQQQHLPGQ